MAAPDAGADRHAGGEAGRQKAERQPETPGSQGSHGGSLAQASALTLERQDVTIEDRHEEVVAPAGHQGAADEAEGARHVVEILASAADGGHEAEGAEVLDVALQRHQVEITAELVDRKVESHAETSDHLIDETLVEIERRITQERRGVVGVRPHAGVLEVDQAEPAAPHEEVPRLEVAVAVDARQ